MKTKVDIAGQRFGRLIALRPTRRESRVMWECICDCGQQKIVRGDKLLKGLWKSCGCLRKEGGGEWLRHNKPGTTHGLSKTPEYRILMKAAGRCINKKDTAYGNYGGRGITFCKEWLGMGAGFLKFIAHIGPRPSPQHSLDRIDNDKGYEPGNVRWATAKEQVANRRVKRIEHFTDEALLAECAKRGLINGACKSQ